MDLDGFTVLLVRSKATHVWHKGMKKVISALKSLGLNAEWKKPEEILEMSLTSQTVLIMADFSCDYFSKFSTKECLVVGPDCLLECIDKKISIPANNSAVYNLAMSDLVISTTNMPVKKKDEIKKLVGWMGGCYTSSFTLAHTHLVADSVNSEKCFSAAEKKKPIMSGDWVLKVWESSLEDPKLRADSDDLISMYRLPPLKGLEITLSNLSTLIKRKYKKLIEENGGTCVGALTQKQTHYVITDKCEGEKVKCALSWGGVHVVSPEWLEKSIEAHAPLPPKPFALKQRPTCSTPTSELPSFMSASDISVVGGNMSVGSQPIEETLNSTAQSAASYVPVCKPTALRQPRPVVPPSPAVHAPPTPKPDTALSQHERAKQIVEEMKPADISKAGSFLDGCKIYLSGWGGSEDKLRRLLIKAGGMVLNQTQRGLTHIVAAQPPSDLQSGCENVVSVDWVLASKEKGQPAEVTPYLLLTSHSTKPPPPSPLSSKGLELLKSRGGSSQDNGERVSAANETFQPPVSRKLFDKTPKKQLLKDVCALNASNEDSRGDSEPEAVPIAAAATPAAASVPSQKTQRHISTLSQKSTMSDTTNNNIFQGLVFTILGFDSVNLAEFVAAIEGQGGSIVPSSFQGVPDYAVLPMEGVPDKFTATEVVNALWIEECLDQGCLVDVQYYHQPVSIRAPGVPLSSAIICLSGFLPKEKSFLLNLAKILGAQVQEAFSRKDNPSKGVLRSTHLVSSEASGSKYEAAIKWGIPVVSKAWLTEAAVKSADTCLPPIQPYSLTKIQPNQDDIETTPMNTKSLKSNCSMTPVGKAISQLPKTAGSQPLSARATQQDAPSLKSTPVDVACPSEMDPPKSQSHTSLQANDNTPLSTKTSSFKESRTSSSMFPSPGGDELNKFNVSLGGVKRRSGERSPLVDQVNTATPHFHTPANQHHKIAKLSDSGSGRSPFHVDTPETPLGTLFYSNPDKKTSKMYSKFIESFPKFQPETPVAFPKKKSPPLHVLSKRILAQLGGDVEGIEKNTGKLLKNGIYSEWADSSVDSSFNSPAPGMSRSDKKAQKSAAINEGAVKSTSKSDKVNELLTLMVDIQKESSGTEEEDSVRPKMEQKIAERLQAVPNQEHNDMKSHPLNRIRPNAEPLLDAKRPSTSSLNKGERERLRNEEEMGRVGEENKDQEQDETQPYSEDGTPTQPLPKKYFMLSSLPVNSKETFEGVIRNLGGEVLLSGIYEEQSTHLVIQTPIRNEKLLCSIASGKWILHTSYLEQCYERRCFLPEECYEWGNPLSESRLPKLEAGSSKDDLAKAAYRWRTNCCNMNQKAFRQMKAVLICRDQSKAMFTRLLNAGAAKIIEDASKCNICLVEEGKVELEETLLESLASRGVPCVPLVYLNNYLVSYPKINPIEHLIEQYKPIYNKHNRSNK